MRPKAVLFDFDGVLADTENVHVAAMERTLALMGIQEPPDDCERAGEEDDAILLSEVFADLQIEGADVSGWVARKQSLTLDLLRDAPRLFPGVDRLVRALRGRARLAIVTGTARANVDAVLSAGGIADAFEVIVAKGDGRLPKPAPDLYQFALDRLGIGPAAAVAVEDSSQGIAAAVGARIRTVAVAHDRPFEGHWAKDAAAVLPDLRDLDNVLAALGF